MHADHDDDDDLAAALSRIPPPDVVKRPEPTREVTDLLRSTQFKHLTVHWPAEMVETPGGFVEMTEPRSVNAVMATVAIHRDDETPTDDDDFPKEETDDDN